MRLMNSDKVWLIIGIISVLLLLNNTKKGIGMEEYASIGRSMYSGGGYPIYEASGIGAGVALSNILPWIAIGFIILIAYLSPNLLGNPLVWVIGGIAIFYLIRKR